MEHIIIDFSSCASKEELHRQIKRDLNLPEWYGANLDALWDCLVGGIELPRKITLRYAVHKKDAQEFREDLQNIMDTFSEAAEECSFLFVDIEHKKS